MTDPNDDTSDADVELNEEVGFRIYDPDEEGEDTANDS